MCKKPPFRLGAAAVLLQPARGVRTASAEGALDERLGHFNSFRELPIVSPFQVSGNRRNINLEPLGGWLERWLVQEAADGLPLFRRDPRHQSIVQAVNQIDGLVERFVVRAKGSQNLEFIEASAFDVFEGHTRELEGFAGEVVDRRLDAVRDFAYADPYAERQRLQPGAQVEKQGGE